MSKIIINKTKITTKIQERVLIIAAALNFAFFLVEIIFGLLINSNAIVSDSFDMLIDTATYLLALWSIKKSMDSKKLSSRLICVIQSSIACVMFSLLLFNFFTNKNIPEWSYMIYLTIGAFIINLVVLILLIKYKTTDKGFTTALFFSSIDVYQNLATIIAAVIIKYTNSIIPDMVVGCLIFVIILISAIKIIIQTYKK